VIEMARERPLAAAATAVGAAAAGLFLWSKRTQISDQLSNLTEQFGDWRESMRANGDGGDFSDEAEPAGSTTSSNSSRRRGGRKNQTQIAEEALTLKETGKATA
jgi:hypothetical protein